MLFDLILFYVGVSSILPELLPSDHGEYICRLHDFDRNLIAERSVPILVYGKLMGGQSLHTVICEGCMPMFARLFSRIMKIETTSPSFFGNL